MTITFATIVNRGYCFLNVFRSGRRRNYPFATYGARSARFSCRFILHFHVSLAVDCSKKIFLPPAGEWPRNGHSRMLLEEFECRRPCLLTWARASFEQGSLLSMLHLSGKALLGVLSDDKFQAQRLTPSCMGMVVPRGICRAPYRSLLKIGS